MSPLTGTQYEALVTALVDAFPSEAALTMMLRFRLDRSLAAIVAPGSLTDQAFYLVQASEAEGWTGELIAAARRSRPRNARLLALAQSAQLPTSHVPPERELQRVITETNRFHDIAEWREKMAAIELQVCRITVASNKGDMFGTGFLVGPDVVLTNHHVVEAAILGEQGQATAKGRTATRDGVTCQFDFKKVAGYLNPGVKVGLAAEWLIDSSPISPIDLLVDPGDAQPDPSQLDYALLRLEQPIGSEPVKGEGERVERDAEPRGWVSMPAAALDVEPGSPIFIVQHPDKAPLSFTLDSSGLIGLNDNATRVRYRTNTLGGSSGSPCFDQDWQLVALHHTGDPNFDPTLRPSYNEGIPIGLIRQQVTARGFGATITQPPPI